MYASVVRAKHLLKPVTLEIHDLSSFDGAAAIIKAISERRSVTHLSIGHNPLGDHGSEILFDWLCSDNGRKYRIEVIHLNVCNIGDRGLLAISRYLKGNSELKELWLQANHFMGDTDVMTAFSQAINSSHLEVLSLSTTLPQVIVSLVQRLDTPYLRELQCCMCSLAPEDAPSLISYLLSPRCRLSNLKANANSIGLRAVRELVFGIERANFSLFSLDLYMNGSGEDDTPEDILAKEETNKRMKNLMTRNQLLMKSTKSEALLLLRHSRRLLLRGSETSESLATPDKTFAFVDLPVEIQLHVLSFLAPTLSSRQRVRIYTYASDPATLPRLLPALNRACMPDPANPVFSSSTGCGNGGCMKSDVFCKRGEEQKTWLALMSCDRYDPELLTNEPAGRK